MIDAPDARTIELTGELAGLRLVHSASVGNSVLEGQAIEAPEGTDVFELWRIAGTAPQAVVREFRPNDDGTVVGADGGCRSGQRRLRRDGRTRRWKRRTNEPADRDDRVVSRHDRRRDDRAAAQRARRGGLACSHRVLGRQRPRPRAQRLRVAGHPARAVAGSGAPDPVESQRARAGPGLRGGRARGRRRLLRRRSRRCAAALRGASDSESLPRRSP